MVRKSENDSRNQFCKNCNDILIFFRFSTFKQISDKCNGGPNEKMLLAFFGYRGCEHGPLNIREGSSTLVCLNPNQGPVGICS